VACECATESTTNSTPIFDAERFLGVNLQFRIAACFSGSSEVKIRATLGPTLRMGFYHSNMTSAEHPLQYQRLLASAARPRHENEPAGERSSSAIGLPPDRSRATHARSAIELNLNLTDQKDCRFRLRSGVLQCAFRAPQLPCPASPSSISPASARGRPACGSSLKHVLVAELDLIVAADRVKNLWRSEQAWSASST
jgi:hypothetical protein